MAASASSGVSIVTKAKPRDSLVWGSRMTWHLSIWGRERERVFFGGARGRGRGGTYAAELAKRLVEVAVVDAGRETANVEVVAGVVASSLLLGAEEEQVNGGSRGEKGD